MAQYCKACYREKIDPYVKDEDLTYSPDELVCDCCGETRHLIISVMKDPETLTVAECNVETQKHIENVRKFIRIMTDQLTQRGVDHDASKLTDPEVDLFAKYTKKLATLAYGTDEYTESLAALKPALDHHYAINRHHPEHFINGIDDMNLIDIVEMLCDWKAATMRMNDGNLLKSIEINAERFGIDGQLKQILINTAKYLDERS